MSVSIFRSHQYAGESDLYFVLEQHEDLKSHEIVDIITQVNSPRIGLLFDFGNMINANEEPLAALYTTAPTLTRKAARASTGTIFRKICRFSTTLGLNPEKMLS
ncbi:MAG: hypothetical protein JRJ33_03745 [Deltaproteobacteria bacterium]|nr:hypothetical protein [Deltaproteobacteria bacterium]